MELGWLAAEARAAVGPIIEQSAWTGLEAFDPLIALGERLLNAFGLYTRPEEGGLHIAVPLTGREDF